MDTSAARGQYLLLCTLGTEKPDVLFFCANLRFSLSCVKLVSLELMHEVNSVFQSSVLNALIRLEMKPSVTL